MKRQAADRLKPRPMGSWVVALCAAAVLVLAGGCGQFNDNPSEGGMSVRYEFAQPAATNGTSTRAIAWDPTLGGEAVLSLVVGAIVITEHLGHGPDGAYDETNVDTLSDAQRQSIEDAAKQSLQYLEVVGLPTDSNSVDFKIPPKNAGTWQLVAIGLRHAVKTLDEVQDDSPIWYGFIGEFLNGKVNPGEEYPVPLVLHPWCAPANANPPAPTGTAPCL